MKIEVRNRDNNAGEIILGEVAYRLHGESAEAALYELARLSEDGEIRSGCEVQAAEVLEYLCDEASLAQGDSAVPFAEAVTMLLETGERSKQMPFYGICANFADALAFALEGLQDGDYEYDREDVFDRFIAEVPYWSTLCTPDEMYEIFRLYFERHNPER